VQDVEPDAAGLLERMRACLPEKIAVWLGLSVGICVPYYVLQRIALFPARSVPATALDRWVPFEPGWIWIYLSIALLVPLAPLCAARRDELARYAKGLCWLCLPCFAAFLFFPVAGPRPESLPDAPLYRLLVAWDRPANSFPSLHAGLTSFSLLFLARVLRDARGGPWRAARALALAWGALILYSTLATRQHWALDLPAGMLLAFAAHALAWRDAQRAARRGELPLAA
jgi:membrane-associated phospholipid phosphatase